MAFSKGKEVSESSFKRYVGVAPVSVISVNPNKAELEKVYNTQLEKDPEYLGKYDDNGTEIPTARIDFIIKTDEERCGVNLISKLSLFIRKAYRFNRDKTKVQVIDKYGRTAWVTQEQLKGHEIPMYTNGPANLDKDYRPCYVGEEDLTNFIKTYLNIPSVQKYVNGKWVLVDNPSDCEARLDSLDNYFKGNFSELKDILSYQPNNKVKVLFGVRNTDSGTYQTVYTHMFLRNGATNYSKLDADVQNRKSNGAYSDTEFYVGDLKEYTVEPTDFTTQTTSDLPFDSTPWSN